MGNKASSNTHGETTSLTDSPLQSRKSRKPAKRTLSFGDKPRKAWSKENGKNVSAEANVEARYSTEYTYIGHTTLASYQLVPSMIQSNLAENGLPVSSDTYVYT